MIEIKHTGIYVDNIEREVDFYKQVFDMTAICENQEDTNELLDELLEYIGARIIVTKLITPKGKETGHGDMIEFVKVLEGNKSIKVSDRIYNIGVAHIAIGVYDIEAVKNKIIQNGGCMKTSVVERANGRKFAFATDPEGNWIEIIQ